MEVLSEKAIEVLKKAGWYEGRKIDITENVKFLEERGFEVLDKAKKFMEEFGELKINVQTVRKDGSIKVSKHSTCIKDVVGCLDARNFGLEDYVKEKLMLIGNLYNGDIDLYISESGRVYMLIGWVADSVWEAWDKIINEKKIVIWDKFVE